MPTGLHLHLPNESLFQRPTFLEWIQVRPDPKDRILGVAATGFSRLDAIGVKYSNKTNDTRNKLLTKLELMWSKLLTLTSPTNDLQ